MTAPETEPGASTMQAQRRTVLELQIAALVTVALAALGAVLGVVWAWWSGRQQRAFVIGPGALYPFDEVETMVGADGRYLFIVALVGLLAGFLGYWLRRAERGPLLLLGLVAGCLAGAALTAWVGHLIGGGTTEGKRGTIIDHLPLSLHMRGLIFVEAALCALVYGILVAFAVRDDLGRADPVRDRLRQAALSAEPTGSTESGQPR